VWRNKLAFFLVPGLPSRLPLGDAFDTTLSELR